MPTININQEGYECRLLVIQSILDSHGLQSTSVTPVEYLGTCPFPYNNSVHKVELAQPATASAFAKGTQRPGSSPLPQSGVSTTIIRLSNPHAGDLNNANRVENEVAAQLLFRQILSDSHPGLVHLVPAIYAWEPCRYPEVHDEMGFAWTICEFKTGANLDEQFMGLELPEKLDKTPLPRQLEDHLGGLKFDRNGQIVGGQMPILPAGPWQRYEDLWASRFEYQLLLADASFALKGWKAGNIRGRIDKFFSPDRIRKLLEVVDTSQRTIVHGDLIMNNMLFDKDSKRLTALLDFDFASITHPVHEFFTGLWHQAILSSNFGEVDNTLSSEYKAKWEVAKAWNSALATRGIIRPSSIQGIEKLEKLNDLEQALCPFQLSNEVNTE
ncbi:hypothetical protein SUNI508_00138 [Seiridium unicorne]|uniref:Aminoglycoside phosphotransferase domain-containing protein n=1 Tax=Seiridium unicorne TaxID=138068 RepID=A0ABR2VJD5_9PEZI